MSGFVATPHGYVYFRASSAMRWHRRYMVLNGNRLELYGSECLEKVAREDKSDMLSTLPLEEVLKKNSKPRRVYPVTNKWKASEMRRTEAYVTRGLSVKQATLCAFSIELPVIKTDGEDVVEESEGRKVVKFDLATEDEAAADQWKNAITQSVAQGASLIFVSEPEPDDAAPGDSSEFQDAASVAPSEAGDISTGPPEASMAVASLGKDQLAELVHVAKFRYVGTYDSIDVVEEIENPRTYMSTVVVRAHPQTVFEELLLIGTVPYSDAVASRYDGVQESEIIERGDNRDVIRIVLSGGLLYAPRELVMERYWRLEEDGTFVLNLNSVDHPACPPMPSTGVCGRNPVRIHGMGGVTISPLKPEFAVGPPEAFVTQILSLTDVGGYLEPYRHFYGFEFVDLPVIRPLVWNLAMVRKTVEAARFTGGTLTVMDRLQAAAAEKRAQTLGKRQHQMAKSFMTAMAIAKFKKGLGKKAARPKAVPLPSNVDRSMWYDPGPVTFKVRGPDYFTDKVKISASAPIFDFVALELFECDQPVNEHIVNRPDHPLQSPDAAEGPFTLVVNLMIPGPPHLNAIVYFRCSDHAALEADTPFGRVWRKFINGTDQERNSRFKLIPTIVEGSWVIKQAVGSTPVILGTKLRTAYSKGPNYFEVDVDISCSAVAQRVTSMCLGVTKSLVIDMAFCLEPHSEDELPESLLGVVRLKKIDLGCRQWLPGSMGWKGEQANKKKD